MEWHTITFGINEVLNIIGVVGGALTTYFILKNRITIIERDIVQIKEADKNKELTLKELGDKIFNKIESLVQQLTDSNTLLKEHISYHKGMEDAEHKNK